MRMAELRITGRVASGGFAAGPVAVFSTESGAARGAGEPFAEAQALRSAIAAALGQLGNLAAKAGRDGADILAFARQRLAGFKIPRSVEFVEELPRSPAGKIQRGKVRAPYWAGRTRQI